MPREIGPMAHYPQHPHSRSDTVKLADFLLDPVIRRLAECTDVRLVDLVGLDSVLAA